MKTTLAASSLLPETFLITILFDCTVVYLFFLFLLLDFFIQISIFKLLLLCPKFFKSAYEIL